MQGEQGTTVGWQTLHHHHRSIRALGHQAIKPQWLRHRLCLLPMPLWQMQQTLSAGFVPTHWQGHSLVYCNETNSSVSPILLPPLPPSALSPNCTLAVCSLCTSPEPLQLTKQAEEQLSKSKHFSRASYNKREGWQCKGDRTVKPGAEWKEGGLNYGNREQSAGATHCKTWSLLN